MSHIPPKIEIEIKKEKDKPLKPYYQRRASDNSVSILS